MNMNQVLQTQKLVHAHAQAGSSSSANKNTTNTSNFNNFTNTSTQPKTTTTLPQPQRPLTTGPRPRMVTRGMKRQLELAVPVTAASSTKPTLKKLQQDDHGGKNISALHTPASTSAKVNAGKKLNFTGTGTITEASTTSTSVKKRETGKTTTAAIKKPTAGFKIASVPRVTTALPGSSRNLHLGKPTGTNGIYKKEQRTETNTSSKSKPEPNVILVDLGTPPRYTEVMPTVRPPGNEVFGSNVLDQGIGIIPSSSSPISGSSDNGDSGNGGSPVLEIDVSNDCVDVDRVADELNILLTFENCTTCSFCTEKLEIGDGIVLQDCFHSFCRPCLITVVENSSSAEIPCPVECGGRLYQREIKALLPTSKYNAYVKRTENKIKELMGGDVFQCKTKDCRGCCVYGADSKVFLCPECNKGNCLTCKAIHDGLECKDFQDLLATAIRDGKSRDEAEEFVHSQLANGWEQFLGTVSGWIGATPAGKNRRKTQDYTKILHKMAQKDLWLSNREFECPVCMGAIPVGDGIILQDCLHTVCKECAIGTVQFATDPLVKCPYQDANYSCTSHLNPREIKALVTPELHEAFLARSVKQAEGAIPNSFHCKTPDCPGWCIVERGAVVYDCQNCSKRNCLTCEAIHENVTCADYKNKLVQNANDETSRKMLEELVAKGQCMLCPTCKIVAEKTAGCDWIVCSVCKTEICWATKGPRWGPKGKGDLSGGCHCREGGKLCVPNCQNCH